MNNAVGDEDIGKDDLGVVNIDVAVADGDLDALAVEGLDGSLLELAAVGNGAGDDVVLEDALEVLLADVVEGAELGEGFVVGGEDSDALGLEEGVDELGRGGGAGESGKVGGGGGVDDVAGDGQDGVDDVDDTTLELDVLQNLLAWTAMNMLDERRHTAWTTVDSAFRALKKVTEPSAATVSTRWPPSTCS